MITRQSLAQFIWVGLTSTLVLEAAPATPKGQEAIVVNPVNMWDEKESSLIFGIAKGHQSQGQLDQAIKEYSEILEFFPGTSVWPLACIELSNIYRQHNNPRACESILKRLTEQHTPGADQSLDTLLAQWDYFFLIKDAELLKDWLASRSKSELKTLRLSATWKERMAKHLSEASFPDEDLLDIWWMMGHPSAIDALIQMAEATQGLLLSRPQCKALLERTLEIEAFQHLDRAVSLMGRNGWAQDVQLTFTNYIQNNQLDIKDLTWSNLWLRFAIKHHLDQEALDLLKLLPEDQHLPERVISLVNLKRFNDGARILLKQPPWLSTALPYHILLKLCRGLNEEDYLQPVLKELLKNFKPALSEILQADLMSPGEARKTTLQSIVDKGQLYGPRAALSLGRELGISRDIEGLNTLIAQTKQKFPTASDTLNKLDNIVNTLNVLKGEAL